MNSIFKFRSLGILMFLATIAVFSVAAMFLWNAIKNALDELPPAQRAIFIQTEFEGLPVKEIAEKTGVPVNTLLSRKHYAVKYLRQRLSGLYDDLVRS